MVSALFLTVVTWCTITLPWLDAHENSCKSNCGWFPLCFKGFPLNPMLYFLHHDHMGHKTINNPYFPLQLSHCAQYPNKIANKFNTSYYIVNCAVCGEFCIQFLCEYVLYNRTCVATSKYHDVLLRMAGHLVLAGCIFLFRITKTCNFLYC